jgi:hypothetical protein
VLTWTAAGGASSDLGWAMYSFTTSLPSQRLRTSTPAGLTTVTAHNHVRAFIICSD